MKPMTIILYMLLSLALSAFAQHPQIGPLNGIHYQAVAIDENGKQIVGTDVNGKPLFHKDIHVRFTITKGDSGEIEYQETHSTNTDRRGLFSLVIGQGSSTGEGSYDSLLAMPWIDADQWLRVEIATTPDQYRIVSQQALMSVPFAFYADDIADDAITTYKIKDQAVDLTTKVSQVLPVQNGGTGQSTLDSNNILLGNGVNGVQSLGAAIDGQIPIGAAGAKPVLSTLTAGPGISVTNGPGAITIASTIVGGVNSNANTTVNPGLIPAGEAWTSPTFVLQQPTDLDPIAMGDIVLGSVDVDLQGCMFHIYVESVNSGTAHARVTIFNPTNAGVNLGNGVKVKILVVQ